MTKPILFVYTIKRIYGMYIYVYIVKLSYNKQIL